MKKSCLKGDVIHSDSRHRVSNDRRRYSPREKDNKTDLKFGRRGLSITLVSFHTLGCTVAIISSKSSILHRPRSIHVIFTRWRNVRHYLFNYTELEYFCVFVFFLFFFSSLTHATTRASVCAMCFSNHIDPSPHAFTQGRSVTSMVSSPNTCTH